MGRAPHARARTRSFAFSMVLALIASSLGGIIGDVGRADALPGPVEQIDVTPAGTGPDRDSNHPALSADGRFVAFQSFATNLVPGDTNNEGDVFVRDRLTGTTERVSLTSAGSESSNGGCSSVGMNSAISAHGQFVVFDACDSLVPGAPVGGVYVRDRQAATTELLDPGAPGATASEPAISADGRFVAYNSVNPLGMIHIFLTDRQTDTTSQIDVTSTGTPSVGHSSLAQGCVCGPPAISADGHYVVFTSAASDLVPGDTNNDRDVFVRDVVGGTTTQESVDSAGSGGDNYSYRPSISGDGSLVAFESGSQNLVAGLGPTAPGAGRVYVHNRLTGTTTLESMDSGIGDYAGSAQISANGRYLAFGDYQSQIWLRDRQAATTIQETANVGGGVELGISGDGARIVYQGGSSHIYAVPAGLDATNPSVTIPSPSAGATYSAGQIVTASYSCADEPGGSGLASCVGTVANGSQINTSLGTHSFSVTATDNAGNSTTVTRSYDVVPVLDNTAPTIVSASPVDGAIYAPGQVVIASYSCADEPGGSGIASCVGTVPNGTAIDTSTPGTGVFEVTAIDTSGNDTHLIRHYIVGGPGPGRGDLLTGIRRRVRGGTGGGRRLLLLACARWRRRRVV